MNDSTDIVTNPAKEILRGFFEIFSLHLQDRESEPDDFNMEFTFNLEAFLPHNPQCHQAILDNLGLIMKTLDINLHLPTNSTLSKETIFRDIWHIYNEELNTHLDIYIDDEDKLAETANEAIT